MRKVIFILSVCILALQVEAQDLETTQLQQAIKQHPQQDTARVNLLNALGNSRSLQGDEIEKLANEALTISRKNGYIKGEAYALLNLSSAKLQLGNRQQSVRLIQQADSIAKKTGDQELMAYVLLGIGKVNQRINNNLALDYKKKAEAIALKINDKKLLFICQNDIAAIYQNSLSDFPKAVEYALKSINSAEEANCLSCLSRSWSTLAGLYNIMGDQSSSLLYYQKAVEANKKIGDKVAEATLLNNIGERYRLMGKYGEAIKAYNQCLAITNEPYRIELTESNLADVYTRLDNLPLAFKYAFSSLTTAKQVGDQEGVSWIYGILSRVYLKKKMIDSAIYYSRQGLDIAKQTGTIEFMRDNANALSNAYAFKKDFENAYNYHTLYINYRDSMLNAEISNKSTVLQYNYNLAKKQAEITALDQRRKVQQNFLISALVVLLLIFITVIILFRSNRQKLQANKLLKEQKQEIENQRDQTDKALAELQQTQQQLVQSEKMASLGELTAGIAHEIQNPLNFVNNFSEVNKDLLNEMKEELEKGNISDVKDIAEDVIKNEEKIAFHGRRADAIVKGMLQHSRKNTGQKELTDINALADEYLRLGYHGLRAKDKSFNTEIKTDFDKAIEKISIVPQDIGRALLNLYNNAFYSVNEKKKQLDGIYQPVVSIQTKKLSSSATGGSNRIEIKVTDNGYGIPQNIVDKIFQPFFTTKPTGQGTGLGLSLAYDIIKAHGGEIKAEAKEGEGSELIIRLPV